eukprot:1551659-Rhodomonas_salina.1
MVPCQCPSSRADCAGGKVGARTSSSAPTLKYIPLRMRSRSGANRTVGVPASDFAGNKPEEKAWCKRPLSFSRRPETPRCGAAASASRSRRGEGMLARLEPEASDERPPGWRSFEMPPS